ncbi:MAG: hypothetical protein FWF41_07520 [Betaproteobacteria bacterium]|nr:hypothetical protein [Betaproteobacteria bacterium]
MGIDLYFSKKPRYRDDCLHLRHTYALMYWVQKDMIGGPMDENAVIPLEKFDLERLQKTLNQLTPENASELFPEEDFTKEDYLDPEYSSDYWDMVKELKEKVSELLKSFDFQNQCIEFSAWW